MAHQLVRLYCLKHSSIHFNSKCSLQVKFFLFVAKSAPCQRSWDNFQAFSYNIPFSKQNESTELITSIVKTNRLRESANIMYLSCDHDLSRKGRCRSKYFCGLMIRWHDKGDMSTRQSPVSAIHGIRLVDSDRRMAISLPVTEPKSTKKFFPTKVSIVHGDFSVLRLPYVVFKTFDS